MARKKNAAFDFDGMPSLRKYAERIGAEQLNFKRWMVREYHRGYYTEKALISVNTSERKVYFPSNPEYAPTDQEKTAILDEVKTVKFPDSILFKNKELILRETGKGNDVTFFPDLKRTGFIMAQERIPTPSGKKDFVPWTVWEDGKVRAMEPTRKLPFWKPEKDRNLNMFMVHEGGKAARYVDWLVNDPSKEAKEARAKHPWYEWLKQFEHWGMIGGALSPHRCDYQELIDSGAQMVIYVCDNDNAGRQVMKDFSKRYGKTLQILRFTNSFPEGFDLGDEFPAALFAKSGVYIGPHPEQLLRSSTWATDVIPNPSGKGAPVKVLKRQFREEWYNTIDPEYFINKYFPRSRYNRSQFNSWAGCFSDTNELATLVLADPSNKVEKLIYDPSKPPGISEKKGKGQQITFNTHVPSLLKPVEGDPQPFIDYMEHLIPDETDRHNMMKFLATIIARPAIKMNFGVLMVSQMQGVGKSTIGEGIMKDIIGEDNISFPGQSELVDSAFNHWLAHKRLIFVHEIYAGHSSKAYDKLKSAITDTSTLINLKFVSPYMIDNWAHVIACSNSMRALKLPDDDRRWFVPEITEQKKPKDFWERFHTWLDEEQGREIIMHWAHKFVDEHGSFKQGEGAPVSTAKQKMIEEGYSPGQTLVSQTLENIKEILASESKQAKAIKAEWEKKGMLVDGNVFVTDMQLVNLIKMQIYDGKVSDRLERPLTVRKIAKARGWHLGEVKAVLRDWPDNCRHGRLISTSAKIAKTPPSQLCNADMEKEARRYPLDLTTIMGM